MESFMAISREYDTLAWYDPVNDTICIRVRKIFCHSSGEVNKKGIIVRIREEALMEMSRGQEYPVISNPNLVRWDLIDDDK
jgi:hypothetical protein